MVKMVLIICAILEFGYDIPRGLDPVHKATTEITRWNAFLRMLFNAGGLLYHFLPNFLIGGLVGCGIECIVGSINMIVVVMTSYMFSVLYSLIEYQWRIQPEEIHSFGFSAILYQWFTVYFVSIFLRFWWWPYWAWKRDHTATDYNKRFGRWWWWMIGGLLMVGGGWMFHFAIMGLRITTIGGKEAPVHAWAVLEGYGVSVIMGLFMLCRFKLNTGRMAESAESSSSIAINLETTR